MNHAVSQSLRITLVLAAALLAAQTAAHAAATGTDSPEARYRAERATCLDGRSNQDRATCLKEAGAALAEARKAARSPASQQQAQPDYLANALARCEKVPEPDRTDCRLIAQGAGTKEGTAAQGGVLYKLVTKTVEPAASAPQ